MQTDNNNEKNVIHHDTQILQNESKMNIPHKLTKNRYKIVGRIL